ncbi:FAD/NAD(P)-binding domain-containing protein [Hypoxylon trugodes]|uniref:FAD/NAD(P)-binding domain-containing protein n=1 Tax=Hypoxylon trugodes TaxID=326681 RepID=UPI00219AEB3D|nr:FAD/NAD(P)-binding domain-containing protein [Hypoxylon trugodes]KAI1394474.1 FAD/NAD(P)-binding domain-containing protein [Hypoxylon trugodes]
MTNQIRIGIVGGGLAGITVAIALVKHPHVDVQVYESAPKFIERGAGIGLSPITLEALGDIIPSAVDFLKTHAGAVEIDAARLVVGSGPGAGTLISDLGVAAGVTLNRAPLLQALLSLLPGNMLHAAKRVRSLEQSDSGVTVAFEDGTDAHFDAVIGADGIFSSIRNFVVGEKPEKYAASPAGWWDCRHLVPFEKAKTALGDESFKVDRQYAWLGDGAAMLHGIVENGTMVQCIIAVIDKNLSTDRKRKVTRQVLQDALPASWYEGTVAKGMVELILDQEDPKGYAIWEHKFTPTYANNQVCIVGDAAHTTSPWQSAGAGMAIEDAFILGHLLGDISSVQEVNAAFRAFDALRRPRCQRVIDTGRKTGHLFCGQDEVAGLDARKLNESLGQTFAHVGSLNLESHKNDALKTMRAFLAS